VRIKLNANRSSLERLVQQSADILAHNALTPETFGPLGQSGFGQPLLAAWERKCEPQRQRLTAQIVVTHKLADAVSDVIKQLHTQRQKFVLTTSSQRNVVIHV
jgi:hypothetical protein